MFFALVLAAAAAVFGRRQAGRKRVLAVAGAGRVAPSTGLLVAGVLAAEFVVAVLAYQLSTSEAVVLDIALWVAQGFLALFFLAAGLPKVIGRGIERWVGFDDLPRWLTVLIGVSEVAAAVALVIPALVGAVLWAVPVAAIGVAVISLMASGFHVRAGEVLPAVETALLAALAGSIAIGRGGGIALGVSASASALVVAIALLVLAVIAVFALLATRPAAPARRVAAAG